MYDPLGTVTCTFLGGPDLATATARFQQGDELHFGVRLNGRRYPDEPFVFTDMAAVSADGLEWEVRGRYARGAHPHVQGALNGGFVGRIDWAVGIPFGVIVARQGLAQP